MREFEESILKIVAESSGIMAKDIARKLGCDRKDVNSALFGALKGRCYQDSSYRWYLTAQKNRSKPINPTAPPDSRLSSICKYYLNCLSLEENNGISTFLNSKYSLKYAELPSLNVDSSNDKIAALIRKVSADKNLMAHVGYPILIEKIHYANQNQDLMIAPVFLFSTEISGGAVSVSSFPRVNMEVIKRYASRDVNNRVHELVSLENDLGLNDPKNDIEDIELYEIVKRLQEIREWQWMDDLDPDSINNNPPINTISQEGIYNRAIFIVNERPQYTLGLEAELSELSQLDEASYRGTALHDWLYRDYAAPDKLSGSNTPLLEVLPMNSEQEQAICHAANNTLTVVTGPPGTGKSQVVSNLIINAAWNGESVLFTSKNNKAVDVVETRVNSLGRRPIVIRIGSSQYAYHLAELISDLLSHTADQNDRQDYERYFSSYQEKIGTYQRLKKVKSSLINLRNNADHMERSICELRKKFGTWFNFVTENEANSCNAALEKYRISYDIWHRTKNSFWGKLFWFAIEGNKTVELDERLSQLNKYYAKYRQPIFSQTSETLTPEYHEKICSEGAQLVCALRTISEYKKALNKLLTAPRFEDVDRKLIKVKSDLADIAEKLWNKWILTRPLLIDAACRNEMNEYVATMRLIGNTDLSKFPDMKRRFKQLQRKMTTFLSCWAVTSLSAKDKVPFQPGIFDLVVIDEASQCDIASALPMLYRAKRAVIIGDPKQLRHICTISNCQDASLLTRYGVNSTWSYSAQSLYELASGLSSPSQIIQLRDHHRSFGDIIEFSNAEFYDSKLRIATNYDRLKYPRNMSPGIRWINVAGNTIRPRTGSAYNDSEVETIVNELRHIVIDNGYTGTIGIVTPFKSQAERIQKAIEKDPRLMNALLKNDFLVDTVHKFQGDERDLMFFSPVISHGTPQSALGFLRKTGNLFNVAITRARAVLTVVGDRSYCSECGISYMEHFVRYVDRIHSRETPSSAETQYPADRLYPKVSNPDQVSDWERHFYTALFDSGIRTIPQYPVDKYRLDLAIIDGARMLDIEVDGEMYHKDWNGELSYRDQLRNQRMFELGWDVKRFWVYQIRDNLQECIEQVRQWCEGTEQ